jgi:hypothetical protein
MSNTVERNRPALSSEWLATWSGTLETFQTAKRPGNPAPMAGGPNR